MRKHQTILLYTTSFMLASCGTQPIQPSNLHILADKSTATGAASEIPQPISSTVILPPPQPVIKADTYTIMVRDLPAESILNDLARDAKVNLDIKPGISGRVTINAINQTLPQILDRIARQVDMRFELDNGTLSVMPDTPYLMTYHIDFINMSRTAKSFNSTSSQISGGNNETGGSNTQAGGNSASTLVTSETKNDLMDDLIKNVTDLLREDSQEHKQQVTELRNAELALANTPTDAASGAISPNNRKPATLLTTAMQPDNSINVFANKETGVLLVRANSRQQKIIQKFIDQVMEAAKRQVLIEATIVEVTLNNQYQQGINWSKLLLGNKGFALQQAGTAVAAGSLSTAGTLAISYLDPTSKFGNISASINLLEQFGNVKVLSSPKLSVMNNQTASMKVADNDVYFTITSTPATFGSAGNMTSPATYTTTPNSVSVGLTMSVTPQISNSDTVTLNVRPSISRILSYATDPNPSLANPCGVGVTACSIAPIQNLIPQIQTREMESVIKVDSGQTVVMGGLIQEQINKQTNEVPFVSHIPLLGNLFQNRNDTTTKTELVIFMRPIVIRDASINGDYSDYRNNLPNNDFFHESSNGKP